MPRRASSGPKPTLIVSLIAIAVLAFVGGKAWIGQKGSSSPLDGAPLDMVQVEINSNALRGNSYVVDGMIDGKLAWTADQGQLISLQVGENDQARFLGIEIPAELSKINIERGRHYAFRVRFRDRGIAVAEAVQPL
ncbi:hypothetical protein HNR46_000579 [Haloferula luteola]|uniref:Uncharacterized protein n=1 Tax=Haloferula luteola TaxID=595692 RepID=A0A840UX99_9BACT|nr:hypothetical protein [Haloferula luteola]MBB5350355.1 hypothetical protein [Haloferula luteola]